MKQVIKSEEQWAVIRGYENYSASTYGRIKQNSNGHIMRSFPAKGYLRIGLRNEYGRKFYYVSRLVMFAFGKLDSLDYNKDEQIDHIDNVHINNNIENLQVLSINKNLKKRFTDIPELRYNVGRKSKAIIGTSPDNKEVFFKSIADAGKAVKLFDGSNICKCLKLKSGHHVVGGYTWRYATEV